MLGKTEGRRRRGRQDEMVGWHQRLSGHEFEQALGDGDGQGRCATVHGVAESDPTEQLNDKLLFAPKITSPCLSMSGRLAGTWPTYLSSPEPASPRFVSHTSALQGFIQVLRAQTC